MQGPPGAVEGSGGEPTGEPAGGGEPTGEPAASEPGGGRRGGSKASRTEVVLERGLAASLRFVLVPVVLLVLSAFGAFAYGAVVFVDSTRKAVEHPLPVGNKIGLFLLEVDLLLIGATLLIAGLGFYELFIDHVDDGAGLKRLPPWLRMRDLNDLKARVIAMIVLVAAVSFVEVLVDAPHPLDLLELGGGVSLVIVALTGFLRYGSQRHGED